MTEQYRSETEIVSIVRDFESCKTAKDQFTHRSHLTVAAWYLANFSLADATQKMRDGLLRFLDHHGVGHDKYNETVTKFWLRMVQKTIAQEKPNASVLETTNAVLGKLSDSRLVFEYYSESRLRSAEAKQGWQEPDLKTLQ
jgi:hypothetical protein